MSVGPPFRQPMTLNGKSILIEIEGEAQMLTAALAIAPYLCTIIIDVLIAGYMLFRPSEWVSKVMELTWMSDNFRRWLFALAFGSFALSWTAETAVFPRLARIIGHARVRLQPNYRKKRRQYKVLLEEMRL
jgi:cation-transporting P-type ATPase 13A2